MHRPSAAQLHALTCDDFVENIPPPSKADQFGITRGSLPMYIPVRPNAGNAAKLVAALLLCQPDMRDTAPLFCSELRVFHTLPDG